MSHHVAAMSQDGGTVPADGLGRVWDDRSGVGEVTVVKAMAAGRAVLTVAALVAAAGCSPAGAAPSVPPLPATSVPFSIAQPPPYTPPPSATPTAAARRATGTHPATSAPAWKTPDYGTAQPAVDAFLKLSAANNAGLKDPAHPPTAVFEKYSQGEARKVMAGSIQDEVNHGTAWRGTPWVDRVEVASHPSNISEVVLTDCPAVSPSWVQYEVKTGKAITQPKQTPPPPYLVTAVMLKMMGTWVMVSWTVDGSKTCTR